MAKSFSDEPKYNSLSIKHIEGGGVGYNTGYTTVQAALRADPNWWVTTPFLDVRGHVFDNGKWAANAGIGTRSSIRNRLYGMNAYYDYRNASYSKYSQVGIGLETLGRLMDVRINGYLPFGKKSSSPYNIQFDSFSGNNILLSEECEFAMKGADADVGFHAGSCDSWSFYGALGPYYYIGPISGNAWGGKATLSASYKQYVNVRVIDSYDNVFHNRIQGEISFSIPLGKKGKQEQKKITRFEPLACRMVQPVERSEIIVVNDAYQYPIAIDPATNSPYYFVFVDNTSASLGTYESPYHSLEQAEDNSLSGQIIYVFPGDGTTTNMNQGITLKPSQKLWGSANQYSLSTTEGSITIPPMSSVAPKITNSTAGGVGITLSTDNNVTGMIIQNTRREAISGTDPGSFSLSSCTIREDGQESLAIYPIYIQTSSPFTGIFDSNSLIENPNGGVYIQCNTGTSSAAITFTNNYATGNQQSAGESAILNVDPNGVIGSCSLNVSNNIITNNPALTSVNVYNLSGGGVGSFSSFTGTFSDNTCTNNGRGISYAVNGTDCEILVSNNTLSNNTSEGLRISSGTSRITDLRVTIDGNQINSNGATISGISGVSLSASCNSLTCDIMNNTINSNNTSGIVIYNATSPLPDMNFTLLDNIIANNRNEGSNAAGGLSLDGFNSLNMTLERNQFSNNVGGSAIGAFGGSVPLPQGNGVISFNNNTLINGDVLNLQFYGGASTRGCLSITNNTSTTAIAYIFYQSGSGPCTITPCNYASVNRGGFDLSGVTAVQSCGGAACP